MGYFLYLKLGLRCIDLLAWPLLALGYPMCASIQAIENDSYADTKNLISYWILLSLIYLFEYAFVKLLEWFQLWHYFKLMIVCWLVIPDFRRSFLVYSQFVHPCISMNPHWVISRIKNWKEFFVKNENFLLQAEDYVQENGTETLENLISHKNMTPNHDREITEVPATGKKENQQNTAHSLEAEEKAVPATEMKQMEQNFMHSLDPEAFKEIPASEKKQLPLVKFPEAFIEIPASEKKQLPLVKFPEAFKEILASEKKQLPLTSGKSLHIEVIEKKEVPADNKANPTASDLALKESKSSGAVNTDRMDGKDVEGGEPPHSAASKKVKKEWTCAICQVTTSCEGNLNSHLRGRKHRAACEALKRKANVQNVNKEQKNPQPDSKPEKSILTDAVKVKTVTVQQNKGKGVPNSVHAPANKTGQLNGTNVNGEFNNGLKGQQKTMGKPVGINAPGLRCNLCNVRCTSEADMASHLNGRKHSATQPGSQPEKSILTDAVKVKTVTVQKNKAKGDPNSVHAPANKTGQLNGTNVNGEFNNGLKGQQKNMGKPVGIKGPLRCNLCNVRCLSEFDMASHLNGRKHLDRIKSSSGS